MLSQLSTKSAVLPNMDFMISIVQITSRWPPISPQLEFCSSGLSVTITPPFIYCVLQLDLILHADELITTSSV